MDKCGVDVNMIPLLLQYKHLVKGQGAHGKGCLLFNVELTPLEWPTNHIFDNKKSYKLASTTCIIIKVIFVGLPTITQVFVTFERVCTHLYVCDT